VLAHELTVAASSEVAGQYAAGGQPITQAFPREVWNQVTVGVPWEAYAHAWGVFKDEAVSTGIRAVCSTPPFLDHVMAAQAAESRKHVARHMQAREGGAGEARIPYVSCCTEISWQQQTEGAGTWPCERGTRVAAARACAARFWCERQDLRTCARWRSRKAWRVTAQR
jgi:hypothetical protein